MIASSSSDEKESASPREVTHCVTLVAAAAPERQARLEAAGAAATGAYERGAAEAGAVEKEETAVA